MQRRRSESRLQTSNRCFALFHQVQQLHHEGHQRQDGLRRQRKVHGPEGNPTGTPRRRSAASLLARGDVNGAARAIGEVVASGCDLKQHDADVLVELMRTKRLDIVGNLVSLGLRLDVRVLVRLVQSIPQSILRDGRGQDLVNIVEAACRDEDSYFRRLVTTALAESVAEATNASAEEWPVSELRLESSDELIATICKEKSAPFAAGESLVVLDSSKDCIGEATVEGSKADAWVLRAPSASAIANHGAIVVKGANRQSLVRVASVAAALSCGTDSGCCSKELQRLLMDDAVEESAAEAAIAAALRRDIKGKKLGRMLKEFDASQKAAFRAASTRRLTLIQGPPGTGKTAVSVAVLACWALADRTNKRRRDEDKILGTADSNVAVDNLLDGLRRADPSLKLLRVGRGTRGDLDKYALDEDEMYDVKIRRLREADVILATCVGSGAELLDRFRFGRVLVDEAAQIREGINLIPVSQGASQICLVGDQCQLPPTTLSNRPAADSTLFARFLEKGIRPHLLDTQYRMHPGLANFVKDAVYAGRLKSGTCPEVRSCRPALNAALVALAQSDGEDPPPQDYNRCPVIFHHVDGKERTSRTSKANTAEADIVVGLVAVLLNEEKRLKPSDVAIIAPYADQVTVLTKRLRGTGIEISSVDAYQGRQKEIVLISTVRANRSLRLGFVSDWRRFNVALTRAKRLVVVVGHAPTLAADPHIWRPFLSWVKHSAYATPTTRDLLDRLPLPDHNPQSLRALAILRTPSLSYGPTSESHGVLAPTAEHNVGMHDVST